MTTKEAKKISLVDYLGKLGFMPTQTKKNGNELWYISPMRAEKTASFKVTISKNSWYDYGMGQGGSILDFVMIKDKCSIGDAFKILSSNGLNLSPVQIKPTKSDNNHKAEIRSIKPLGNKTLCKYLIDRGISIEIAKHYLKEVYYQVGKSNYFALGMENNAGGFEARCKIFKGCIDTKDISSFCEPQNVSLSVFEGFMDYLSILTDRQINTFKTDVIILHSTANLNRLIKVMANKKYQKIYAFFDNDPTGQKALEQLTNIHSNVKDMRYLYQNFNDYNEMLTSKSKIYG